MPTTYQNLVNINGTIYNQQTGVGYSTPEVLAKDLGILPHQIDWSKITSGSLPKKEDVSQSFVYAGSNKPAAGQIFAGVSPYDPQAVFTNVPYSPGSIPDFIADQGRGEKYWKISSSTSVPPPVPPPVNITAPVINKKFQESGAYKTLSAEEKETVDLLYNVISIGGEREADLFAQAIQQSIAVAEPWAKSQMALALAEFAGSVDETIFGFKAKTEAIQRARDILQEDISSNKEFLSLEQQSEISRQIKNYNEDLLTIADVAAEKGITFAAGARSRALAETRRTEQFQDVIQSAQRQQAFKVKELELRAARGDAEAQQQLATLKGEEEFALKKIGRSAEEVLGTAGLPAIPGYAPVGGVPGTIAETKEKRIISDVGGIVGLSQLLTKQE